MEEVHERKTKEIGRKGLLHLHRGGAQGTGNACEGRYVGVNRERPQHAQYGEEGSEGPLGGAPKCVGVGIHRVGNG